MKTIATIYVDGEIVEKEIEQTPDDALKNNATLNKYLVDQMIILHPEGKFNWGIQIIQNRKDCLIPFYVVYRPTGETIEVK